MQQSDACDFSKILADRYLTTESYIHLYRVCRFTDCPQSESQDPHNFNGESDFRNFSPCSRVPFKYLKTCLAMLRSD